MSEQSLTGQTLGSYEIGRRIGKGGCGTVYRARLTEAGPGGAVGATVAVKVFHPELITDERIFQRFEREADLGMRIRHTHIVPTFDCGACEVDGATYHYMAMEFVEGETLREVLHELGVVPEDLLYQIADQVLDALSAVHAEGMIHRDVKPENIVITRDQQVRVMDLGVARLQQEGRDLTLAGEFIGSLAYAAPEQFTDQDYVDPRADIYAVGVLLYEMGTGVNPYDEADLRTLIEKKVRLPVRRPRLFNRDLDPFLDEAIQTCLQISPDARFQTCTELREVLATREESAWWQARIEGEAFPAATRALRRLRPTREAPLVGRETELERLHGRFESARSGSGGVALVSGPAGIGKSRLVHDFLEDLMAPDGPVILAGRCPEASDQANAPFLQAALGYVGERDGAEERLLGALGEAAPLAQRLAGMLFGEVSALGDDDLKTAFAALLKGLARDRPVVLAIEDVQRADAGTLALIEHVARAVADQRVLVVVTWRSEETGEGSALHALTTAIGAAAANLSLPLGPLDREGVEALLEALMRSPRTVRALSWPMTEASTGNPHFLLEIVGHLRDSGALEETADGWKTTRPVQDVALPESVRVLLLIRLVEVEPDLMQLLEAASAQGPEFDASLLASVTGQKRLRLLKRLAVLERKHGILHSSGRSAFRFASHGLWQVIYEAMHGERRIECHALCADAIRADAKTLTGEPAWQWVRHMLLAGRLDEAVDMVDAAIEHASTQVHAVGAIGFLERLAEALGDDQRVLRFNAWMRLSMLHRLLGETEPARRALERAGAEAEQIGAAGPRGRVVAEMAAASLRSGDPERAQGEAERALALADEVADVEGRARALHTLGSIAFRTGEFARAAEQWREAAALWREVGGRRGEAAALLQLGAVMPEIGERRESLSTREAALAAFRDAGDRRGEAAAQNSIGNAAVEAGDLRRARTCYEQSLSIVRDLGDLPAEATTLHNIARLHSIESRIEEAKATFERALDIFRQLGDPAGEASVLDELGSSVATFGDHELALECLEQARDAAERTGDRAVLTQVLRHLANVHHESGATEEAWQIFERALAATPASARSAILADMGNAALRENDPDRATGLLEDSLACAEGTTRQIVSLCRLARAHHEAGRAAEARSAAERVEALIGDDGAIAPQYGPEVYYSLATVFAGERRGVDYLVKANALLGARMRAIRTVVYREHYLTTRWPNREILMELRGLDS